MSYTALYRKFRPKTFDEVKGQEHITLTLKNQIDKDRHGHAYLFCGTRGTGKTSVAKIMARAVNCTDSKDGNPCNECENCRSIMRGNNLNVIEMDAASNNGVEAIRDIVEGVRYSPVDCKYKVYIIDEVHMLSISAFNALLKTLEEPPEYVIFILATTEPHKIPITILSRCQRYDFRHISLEVISDSLKELCGKEGIKAEEKALRYIAKQADGSMRDALSLLDECEAFCMGDELTYDKALDILGAVDGEAYSRLLGYVIEGDVIAVMREIDEVVNYGRDISVFVSEFIWYMRNLLLIKTADSAGEIIDMSAERIESLKKEADKLEVPVIMRYIRVLSELSNKLRTATQKRTVLEVEFIKLMKPAMDGSNVEALYNRIEILENKLEESVLVSKEAMANMQRYGSSADGYGNVGAAAGYGGFVGNPEGNVGNGAGPGGEIKEPDFALPEETELVADYLKEHMKDVVKEFQVKGGKSNTLPTSLKHVIEIRADREGRLWLVTDGIVFKGYLEKNSDTLQEFFVEKIGKQVEFKVITKDDLSKNKAVGETKRVYNKADSMINFTVEDGDEDDDFEDDDIFGD